MIKRVAHIYHQETPDIKTSSEEYARRFSGRIGEWFLKVQEEAVLKMLLPYHGATVLDVGGGHGQLVGPLLRNGYKVTVLGSSEVCKRGIQKFIESNLCEFKTGDILDIPYGDRSFDIVISFRLLPHVRQWRRLISELTRVAREAVILDYPTIKSLNYLSYIFPLFFKLKRSLEANTRPFTLFREHEILEAFRENNFIPSERYPQFFLPMVLHRALKWPGFSISAEKVFRFFGLTNIFGSPVILKLIRKGS